MGISAEMSNLLAVFVMMVLLFVIYEKLKVTVKLFEYYWKTSGPTRWISLATPVFEDLRVAIWTIQAHCIGDYCGSYSPDAIRRATLPKHVNQVLRQAMGTEVFTDMQQCEPSVHCSSFRWTADNEQNDKLESKCCEPTLTSILKLDLGFSPKCQNLPVKIKVYLGVSGNYLKNIAEKWSKSGQGLVEDPDGKHVRRVKRSPKKSKLRDDSHWLCNLEDTGDMNSSSWFTSHLLKPTSYLHSVQVVLHRSNVSVIPCDEAKSESSQLEVDIQFRIDRTLSTKPKDSISTSQSMTIRLEDVEESKIKDSRGQDDHHTIFDEPELEFCVNEMQELKMKIMWPNRQVFEAYAASEIFMLLITSTEDSADIVCFSVSANYDCSFPQRIKQVKTHAHYIADFPTSMFFQIEDMFGISELDDISHGNTYVRCTACFSESVSTVFLPCRHACLCVNCLITMKTSSEEISCPICRSSIEGYARWQTSKKEKLNVTST